MSKREIILIGHGSRVPEAVEEFVAFAKALSKHIGQPVDHCFLELAEPEMMHGLHEAAERAGQGGELLILPMFLGAAFHMKSEIAGVSLYRMMCSACGTNAAVVRVAAVADTRISSDMKPD